jgi:hypothetical protein
MWLLPGKRCQEAFDTILVEDQSVVSREPGDLQARDDAGAPMVTSLTRR